MNTSHLRRDYHSFELRRKDLHSDPFRQFQSWFQQALEAEVIEPNAMTLATATKSGIPSCRLVLMKHFDENGFIFFTNYESRKAQELDSNPNACLDFWWKEQERQVIIEGKVKKTSRKVSEDYFSQRPRKSQIAASISQQGKVIPSRDYLEEKFADKERLCHGEVTPLPEFWGGYVVLPFRFEFWQGRRDRLHDRFQYVLREGVWVIERLSP